MRVLLLHLDAPRDKDRGRGSLGISLSIWEGRRTTQRSLEQFGCEVVRVDSLPARCDRSESGA
jgi:hypothetical protein